MSNFNEDVKLVDQTSEKLLDALLFGDEFKKAIQTHTSETSDDPNVTQAAIDLGIFDEVSSFGGDEDGVVNYLLGIVEPLLQQGGKYTEYDRLKATLALALPACIGAMPYVTAIKTGIMTVVLEHLDKTTDLHEKVRPALISQLNNDILEDRGE